jgi:hypothetical protein
MSVAIDSKHITDNTLNGLAFTGIVNIVLLIVLSFYFKDYIRDDIRLLKKRNNKEFTKKFFETLSGMKVEYQSKVSDIFLEKYNL